ncbi:MAG: hypothetical protein KDC49_15415 [Saprospiraceae bacterium]|nr:hypothetical protein [Saprospiraceae bacterium]
MRWMIYIFLSLVMLSSCEMVTFPDPVVSEPVFYAKGSLDGKSLEWVAGKDGFYMFTDRVVENDKVYLEGKLAPDSCIGLCRNALRMRVLTDGLTDQATQSFALGEKPINTTKERAKMQTQVSVANRISGISENKSQIMLDGETLTSGIATTTSLGVKTLNYTAQFGEKLFVQMQGKVNPRVSKSQFPVVYIDVSEKSIRLKVDNTNLKGLEWSNGSNSNIIEAASNAAGRFVANLTSVDGDTFTYIFEFKLPTNNTSFSVSIDLQTEVLRILEPENPRQIHSVIIDYVDEFGNVYTSKDIEQTKGASVLFQQSEDYANDATGRKTRKVDVLINCALWNAKLNRVIAAENLEVVFAFGY